MQHEQIFQLCSTTAMLMWLLMIIAPNWKVTRLLMDYKVIPVILSIAYGIYIISTIGSSGFPDFGSLSSVMLLFSKEDALLAGWIHYLAFDLLVGMWILEQNRSLKLHHLIIIPCLLGTFMFGPLGFLLFFIIKSIKTTSK